MRKSTKGAVAASLAAMLLIGAWGTQASWTATGQTPSATADTGQLALTGDCGDGWLLALDVGGTEPLKLNPDILLSPGDLLTLKCTFTVSALGTNLKVKLDTSAPDFSGADEATLADALDITASYVLDDGTTATNLGDTVADATVSDGDILKADIQVVLDGDGSLANATQKLIGTLDAITVTASQV